MFYHSLKFSVVMPFHGCGLHGYRSLFSQLEMSYLGGKDGIPVSQALT